MKKIVCMLLLIQSGFLMAQTETLVTPNGKKVKVFTNPLITANNGLRTENGNVELGGALLKPTTILTNSENTLTIDGLQVGADTDNILVADANGVLKFVTRASIGDNMGDHTATQTLKMGYYKINNGVDVNDWGLGFSNRDKDYMVRVENASLKVEILPDYKIRSLEDAKELKLVTVDNGGNPLGITSFEDAINKAKEYFIIPSQDLSDIHSKDGFPNQTITLGQLVYNTNDAMENGSGKGLYYWGILQDGNVGWIAATKDNLGNHIATQTLDMGDNPINDGGGNWGLKFEKGEVDFDPETKDFLNSNRARFGGSFVVIDHLPNLKPNDPSEKLPNGFEFVTQNISGEILRSTSLNEVMDAAQNQYFMPKISLADNIVGHAVANLLQIPKEGQFVYNTNPDMQDGKGIGIYYNQDNYWIPLANAAPGDNLGNHIADKDLDMNTKNISNATNVTASGTVTGTNLTAKTKTITPAAQITTGAGAGKIAVSDASGNLTWTDASTITVAGDNLGNHIAAKTLNMNGKLINGNGADNWGMRFPSIESQDKVVSIDGAGFSVENLNFRQLGTVDDANMIKFITVDGSGDIFKIINLKEVIRKSQEFYTVPDLWLSNNKSKTGLQYEPLPGQLVYNNNDNMQNGNGAGLYYWDGTNNDTGWVSTAKDRSAWQVVLTGGTANISKNTSTSSIVNFIDNTIIGTGGVVNGNNMIEVPKTGLYEISFNSHTKGYTSPYLTAFEIRVNGVVVWSPNYASPSEIYGTNSGAKKFLKLNFKDSVTIYLTSELDSNNSANTCDDTSFVLKLVN